MPAGQHHGGGGAGNGTNGAAGAAADAAWDPWDCVPPGKTELTSKEYLQTQFTATSCGGLRCNTCRSFIVLKTELESRTPSGVSGILTNHFGSNVHKDAKKGQEKKAKATGLYAFMRPKPAAGSQEEGGEAAAAASAAASSSAAAAPAGTGKPCFGSVATK